jgi:hypothetical protein
MKRICPHTGLEFEPKRKNQIYIDDKARRDYHNYKQAEELKLHYKQIQEKKYIKVKTSKTIWEIASENPFVISVSIICITIVLSIIIIKN